MEEIKVYFSLWKDLRPLASCIVLGVVGFWVIWKGGPTPFGVVCIIAFALGTPCTLYHILKGRVFGNPVLTITDKYFKEWRWRQEEVFFSDVKKFFLVTFTDNKKDIGICYKNTDRKVFSDEDWLTITQTIKSIEGFNVAWDDIHDFIDADGLSMSPRKICDILNARLND